MESGMISKGLEAQKKKKKTRIRGYTTSRSWTVFINKSQNKGGVMVMGCWKSKLACFFNGNKVEALIKPIKNKMWGIWKCDKKKRERERERAKKKKDLSTYV